MTNTENPKPIADWENEEVKGLALCGDEIYRKHVEKLETLREQQHAYEASLPDDPHEAIMASLRKLHPDGDSYPEGLQEAADIALVLEEVLLKGDLNFDTCLQPAMARLAGRVSIGLEAAMKELDGISDILGAFRKEKLR